MSSRHRLARLSLAALAMVAAARAQGQFSDSVDDSTCPGVYAGGWALRVDTTSCPPDAPVWCEKGRQTRCCSPGLTCQGEGDYIGNYCCTPGEDCVELAYTYPQCPDTDWTLFGAYGNLDNGGWCCKPGKTGTYWNDSKSIGVGCITRNQGTVLDKDQSWAEPVPVSTRTACSASSTSTSPSPTRTSDTADPSGSSSPGHSLGAGPIVGIAVGSVAAVALLGTGIWLLLARSRRKSSGGGDGAAASAGPSDAGGPGALGNPDVVHVAGAPPVGYMADNSNAWPPPSPGNISSLMTESAHSPGIAEADSIQKNQPFEMDGTNDWHR